MKLVIGKKSIKNKKKRNFKNSNRSKYETYTKEESK